jgi:hypothetical protein
MKKSRYIFVHQPLNPYAMEYPTHLPLTRLLTRLSNLLPTNTYRTRLEIRTRSNAATRTVCFAVTSDVYGAACNARSCSAAGEGYGGGEGESGWEEDEEEVLGMHGR